ncbi:MAG TPA: kynureninase [Myxococcales bacterium]|nr:kynureninase [Myxococcales bacterium]
MRAPMTFEDSAAWAQAQDARDPLSPLRSEFFFPPRSPLYFAGHSLGLQPRRALDYVVDALFDWAHLGVEGHFAASDPWVGYHELLCASTARIAGALPHEVVVMNTLSVNLHLMMASFYRPRRGKERLLIEKNAFPSDQYAAASQARFHGFPDAVLESDEPLRELSERDDIALALIGSVNYLTGRAYDIPALVRAAHAQGAFIGFDLAHGAGNLVLHLHDDGPDFAAWCSYKYLNGGPGGPGGVFVHERHATAALPRFEGWWGHDKASRFEMGARFSPMPGAEGWQLSNPPILQLAALRASMELFDRATMPALRRKGDQLTGYLEFLLRSRGVEVLTPRERGSMLTVRFRKPGMVEELKECGAAVDLRPPDIVRITPAPLYNSFEDVRRLCALIGELQDA